MAHYLYHLVSEKKISLKDDISKLDLDKADHQKVAEMIQNNVLGFHRINIYSLKMNQKDFVFIFARSHQEAIQFYARTFQQTPMNCHEYPLDFEIVRGNEVITFRKMRKKFMNLPAVAGYYTRL